MRRGKTWAQVWSIDLFIAVVIFLLALGVFYFFMTHNSSSKQSTLQVESQLIADKLTGDEQGSVVNGTSVDDTKLNAVLDTPYDQLKQQLNVRDDFCIIFKDQNGNLLVVGNGTSGNRTGIGNGNLTLNISGTQYPCGEEY